MLKACVTEKIEVSELSKMVDQSEIKIPTQNPSAGKTGDTFQK